jgi:hypothetical protein
MAAGRQVGYSCGHGREAMDAAVGEFKQEPFLVTAKRAGRAIAWIAGIIAALLVGAISYQGLDESGWMTHDHSTPVAIRGEWLANEIRTCQLMTGETMVPGQRDPIREPAELFCTDGDERAEGNVHTLPIRYFGQIDRIPRTDWSCQRGEDRITCKAIN